MDLGCAILFGGGPAKSGPAPRTLRPEPARLTRAAIARDVRALGLFCFEALTGRALDPDESDPPRVSDVRPELGPHFDEAVAALVDPAATPKSAREAFELVIEAARAAGYEVDAGIPAAPRPSSEESQEIAATSADLLHDPALDLGSAPPDFAGSDGHELALPLRRSQGWLYAVIALGVLAALAVALWLTGHKP